MKRTLFLGDSHTCGYTTIPGKIGVGSFEAWQENNYAEQYAMLHDKKTAVYAMAGASNKSYTDWLRSLLNKYHDVDEVFILLSGFNRFMISANPNLNENILPVDHFMTPYDKGDGIDRFYDEVIVEDFLQLNQKPNGYDYEKFPKIEFSMEHGLISPDLRKNTYMEIKTWMELNTHLEQREFFKDVYIWDKMCADVSCKLYLFQMTDRLKFPSDFNFYGKLTNTVISPVSIQSFFGQRNIDHTKYYLVDKEHYNVDYHKLIADKFLNSLTKPK